MICCGLFSCALGYVGILMKFIFEHLSWWEKLRRPWISVTGSSSGWWRWNFFLTTADVYFKYLESIVSITPMFVFDFSLEIISLSLSLLFLFPSAFVVWAGWRQPPGWECSWTSHHLDELPWKCQRGTRRTQISWAEQKLWEGVPAHQKCPSEYLHFYRIPFSPWVGHFVPTY